MTTETVIEEIAAERCGQITREGWTEGHDDNHIYGQLAEAAICYARGASTEVEHAIGQGLQLSGLAPYGWPWDPSWWKPKTRRLDLVKAGALITAEIERLDRLDTYYALNSV